MSHAILVVEDDENVREFVDMVLTNAGYLVATASDGSSALNLLRRSRPNLILLDIALPKLSGLEVLKTLRQRGNDTQVLMMTANRSADVVREVMALGGNGYLLKPLEPEELVARVRKALAAKSTDVTP